MRRYSLGFVLLFLVCVSCTDIGEDEKYSYRHYISNNTDKVIGIKIHATDIIEPGQSVDFGITVSGSGCNPSGVFNISSRDGQVRVIFNDSIEELHYKLRTDSGFVNVPSEHNILDVQAWEVDDVEQVATYTITEEDYQRALEQSKK